MSALLRRIGLLLVVLANRIDQRSRMTLALEPLAPGRTSQDDDDALCELRHRVARYY
jgi:hypothetical protein